VWLFGLVSVYASREVTLQKECLAQSPASIQEQHLPTGAVALPGAVQGCKFQLPVIKRIWFDGHVNADYELSLYTMSTHIQIITVKA
jgi:hypothetical protein